MRGLNCDACGRRYGVFAVGLFCPDCGAPNLLTHFTREVELISQQIALADAARDNGRRELAFRLLGNAHEDVLTAFETYLKTAHRQLARKVDLTDPCAKRVKTNRFQNISRTREAFAELGVDPFAALDHSALAFLRLNIEKRHVVGHNLGIVDEHFADAAEEEQPGRTVILLAEEIARFAELCRRIIAAIDDLLLSAPTPASAAPDATTDSPPANGGDDERTEL